MDYLVDEKFPLATVSGDREKVKISKYTDEFNLKDWSNTPITVLKLASIDRVLIDIHNRMKLKNHRFFFKNEKCV